MIAAKRYIRTSSCSAQVSGRAVRACASSMLSQRGLFKRKSGASSLARRDIYLTPAEAQDFDHFLAEPHAFPTRPRRANSVR